MKTLSLNQALSFRDEIYYACSSKFPIFVSMRLEKVIIVLIMLLAFDVQAQELYNVEYKFKIEGAHEGEKVSLAYHLGSKKYVKDSMFANAQGEFSYKADTLHVGLYMLVFPEMGNKFFEFIVNEKRFSLSTSKEEFQQNMRFAGSQENAIFYSYLNYLNTLKSEAETINENTTLSEEAKKLELEKINNKVKAKQDELTSNFSEMMIGKIVEANISPEVKKAPDGMPAEKVQAYQFNSYKSAFMKGVDLTTAHLMYTPFWEQKMETYLEQLTVSAPDSIIESVDYIMSMASHNAEMKQFTAAYLLNKYAVSRAICFDKIYVHIADEYYANGKASWVSKEQLQKIAINANGLKPVLCGEVAPNIQLPNEKGIMCNMQQIEAKWTLVVFWKSSCDHCKSVIEDLIEMADTSNLSLEIVTVSTEDNKDEWLAFVNSHKMSKWTNLGNYNNDMDLNETYYLQSTPTIYLLDEQKVIKYKRLDVEQVYSIVSRAK